MSPCSARQGFLPTKRHILQSRTGSTCSSMQMLNLRVRVGLCVILSLLWASKVYGEVLAAGKLEKCVRDGVTEVVQCSDKLVITVTVANGQTLKTEELDLTVLCVNSPTGECPCPCNAAVDEDCSCRDLAAPMKVTITKSLLWASYPLTFVQQFNWKPVEIIQYTNSKKCRDGDYEQYPTCPYYYDGKDKVPDSQGFCCQCSSGEVWDDTFGDLKYRTRANLNCDFRLGMLIGIYPAAAHCVQLDRFNFAGYNVGPPSLNFEIYVNIEIPTIPAGWSPRVNGTSSVSVNATTLSNGTLNTSQNTFVMRYETLTLSPSIPLAVSKTKMVSVKLLGDLAMYTMLPTFGHQMLMLPLYDIGNRSTWMLVDKSLISLDGRTCDKIGTSFSAFRYQPSGCHRAVSTCLKGQLKDLYDEDMDRIKKGRAPLYMVSQYPGYEQASFTAGKFGNETVFLLPVTSQSQSVLTLTVSADKLRLITNRSPGKISDVQLCRFGNASHCGFFEAGNRGYIRLNVTNTGRLDADYTVAVTNCSSNIRPIEARMIAVSAGRTAPLWPPIEVYVEDTENKTRSCSVLLYDSTGGIADQTEMSFSTNQTDFGPTPTGGFNGTGDSLARLEKDLTCDEACTNPINVWCIVVKRCWSKLFRLFGFMGGLFGGLGLLALAIKYGWLAALFGMCCNRAGSGDGGGANGWFNKSGDGVNTDNGGGTQMGNNKQPMPPMHQNNVYYGDGKQRPSSAQSLYNPNDPSKRMSNTNSIRYDARSGGRLQDTMGGLRATQRTEASRQSWFNPAAWAMRPSSRAGSLTGSVANGRATGLSVPGGSQRASMDGSRSSQWLQMPHRSWLSPSTWGGAARPSSRAGSITGSVANGFKPPGTEDGPRPSHQSSRSTWLNLATWASSGEARPSSRAGSLGGPVVDGRATGLNPQGSQPVPLSVVSQHGPKPIGNDGPRPSHQSSRSTWLNLATWASSGEARPSSHAGSLTGSPMNGRATGLHQGSQPMPQPSGASLHSPRPPGTEDGPRPSHQSSRSTWLNLATWASSGEARPSSRAGPLGSPVMDGRATGLSHQGSQPVPLSHQGRQPAPLNGVSLNGPSPPGGMHRESAEGARPPQLPKMPKSSWFRPAMWGPGAAGGMRPSSPTGPAVGAVAGSRGPGPSPGNNQQAPGVGVSMAPAVDPRASMISAVEPVTNPGLQRQLQEGYRAPSGSSNLGGHHQHHQHYQHWSQQPQGPAMPPADSKQKWGPNPVYERRNG